MLVKWLFSFWGDTVMYITAGKSPVKPMNAATKANGSFSNFKEAELGL